jgi:hypothetical protein
MLLPKHAPENRWALAKMVCQALGDVDGCAPDMQATNAPAEARTRKPLGAGEDGVPGAQRHRRLRAGHASDQFRRRSATSTAARRTSNTRTTPFSQTHTCNKKQYVYVSGNVYAQDGVYVSNAEASHAVHCALEHARTGCTVLLVTPYRKQLAVLKSTLEAVSRGANAHVTVCTVDGAQGQEADVVVLSLVKRAPTRFLTRFRLCVMLSRARRSLVVVGDRNSHKSCRCLALRDVAQNAAQADIQPRRQTYSRAGRHTAAQADIQPRRQTYSRAGRHTAAQADI